MHVTGKEEKCEQKETSHNGSPDEKHLLAPDLNVDNITYSQDEMLHLILKLRGGKFHERVCLFAKDAHSTNVIPNNFIKYPNFSKR